MSIKVDIALLDWTPVLIPRVRSTVDEGMVFSVGSQMV